jgi:hypothetical protein
VFKSKVILEGKLGVSWMKRILPLCFGRNLFSLREFSEFSYVAMLGDRDVMASSAAHPAV